MSVGGYCRMNTMTTGIYVLNTAVCHSIQLPYPVVLCYRQSPPGYSTSRRLLAHPRRRSARLVSRSPRRRRRRRRPRAGRGRPSARSRTHGPPPYIIANITHSVARYVRPTGLDLASTADRQLALCRLRIIPSHYIT